MRISLTDIRRITGDSRISREDAKAAEYVFRTIYGYFPRVEDSDKFMPVVLFVTKEWQDFWHKRTVGLRGEFFHGLIDANRRAVEEGKL